MHIKYFVLYYYLFTRLNACQIMAPRKKKPVVTPQALKKVSKPHGIPGGLQRTPLHAFDKAGNQDMYEIEDVIAERLEKGVPRYLIRWKGFGAESDTWEPIEHLAGAEEYIARFREEREASQVRAEAEIAEKRARKRAEAQKQHEQSSECDASVAVPTQPVDKHKKSWVWKCFEHVEDPAEKKPQYKCLLMLDNGSKCDAQLTWCGGTTNMANHLRSKHAKYVVEQEMKRQSKTLQIDGVKNTLVMDVLPKFTTERRHAICRKIAYWLVRRNRPLTMVERDSELREVFLEISSGRFNGCSHHEIQKHILQMVAVATENLKLRIADVIGEGLRLALVADLWSQGTDCALLGVYLYWIDKDFVLQEVLAGAVPFNNARHTAENIRAEAQKLLHSLNISLDDVFARVCDRGSNMKKALSSLEGLFCSAHTLERSVLKFTDAPGVKETIAKTKGITRFFHHSPLAMSEMLKIQGTNNPGKETHKPPSTGNATRWHFTHDATDWYRQHQQTIQMFDITQWGGEGYREYKLDYSDWQTIHQAVAVLDPSAKMTNMTEGTKYPTLPLVLPMITRVIQHAEKPTLNKPWDKMSSFGVLTQHIQVARRGFIEDLRSRWIDNLPCEVRSLLITSTFLDPRFKSFEFPWHGGRTAGLRVLREKWCAWKGTEGGTSTSVVHKIAEAKNDDCLSAFFDESVDEEDNAEATLNDTDGDLGRSQIQDELEMYLQTKDAPKQTEILGWWKEKTIWPKLQLMARQYLAVPATSAGVERLFSKATLVYDDLAQAMKEETLGYALFASYNYSPALYEGFVE